MGDSALYQHSGAQLIKSFQPFSVNPEVPVLGKLLYGISIQLTGNPQWFTLLSYICVIVCSYHISKLLKFEPIKSILVCLLIAMSSLQLEQLTESLLDLPQTAFFLLHLMFLFSSVHSKKNWNIFLTIIFSGISLGLFASTKFPLYLPFILLIDLWYLYKRKKTTSFIVMSGVVGATYVATYAPFIGQNGIVAFFKAQKWILNFYLISDAPAQIGMVFITALTGWYKGWWGSGWEYIKTWDGSFILGIGSLVYYFRRTRKQKFSLELTYISYLLCCFLFILIFIPFWPRYLVIVIPFFTLLITYFLKNSKFFLLLLIFPIIGILITLYTSLTIPSKDFYSLWKKAGYSEMYNYFSPTLQQQISRIEWEISQREILNQLKANQISAREESFSSHGSEKIIILALSYTSYHGEKNQVLYKIIWKNSLLKWKISSIKQMSKNRISDPQNQSGTPLCVLPTKVKNWSNAYEQTAKYLQINSGEARDKIMNFFPQNYCIPVGYTQKQFIVNEKSAGIYNLEEFHKNQTEQ